jgi:hypothetical protein
MLAYRIWKKAWRPSFISVISGRKNLKYLIS